MTSRARRPSLTLLTLVLVGWAGGCGGESDRDRMEGYLDDANAVQKRSAPAFRQANNVYRRFSTGDLPPSKATRELARAERAIRSARAQLARLDPPSEAAKLHHLLLRLYDSNASLAGETTQLGRYLPAAAAALRPLAAINRRLRADLRMSSGPEAQAAALERYADELKPVVTRSKRLRPPPILATSDRARLRRLALTRSVASRLQMAIQMSDSQRVAQLLLRFRRVTRSGEGARNFAARSLRAYNRRYRKVIRASGEVQQEYRRIERSL